MSFSAKFAILAVVGVLVIGSGVATDSFESVKTFGVLVAAWLTLFIYSFLYSPRPLSPAAGWEETVPKEEKLRRLLEVNALQAEIQMGRQRACVGALAEVLVDGAARRDPGEACGRTPQWRVVNFPGDAAVLHGRLVPVRITEAHRNSLRGVLAP